ncbi:hypothetical protein [Idiomarina abyssalis]|uniref:hypothetical protein n=1 Tax=Idiomarina abyssalis TaxID=86102 RepID=UPI001CD543BE|nr:hypothetical protein [Idiomarina abyssalis]
MKSLKFSTIFLFISFAIFNLASAQNLSYSKETLKNFKEECLAYDRQFFSYNNHGPSLAFERRLKERWPSVKESYIKGAEYHSQPWCLEDSECDVSRIDELISWRDKASKSLLEVESFITDNFQELVEATKSYETAFKRYKRMQVTRREGYMLYGFCAATRYLIEVSEQLDTGNKVIAQLQQEKQQQIELTKKRKAERKAREAKAAEEARLAKQKKEQAAEKLKQDTAAFYQKLEELLKITNDNTVLVTWGDAKPQYKLQDYATALQLSLYRALDHLDAEASSGAFKQPEKGEFETTEKFNQRAAKERADFEAAQEKARVEAENKKLDVYKQAIKNATTPLALASLDYNADREVFDAIIKAGNASLTEGHVQVPLDEAKAMKKALLSDDGHVAVSIQLDDELKTAALKAAALVVFKPEAPHSSTLLPLSISEVKIPITRDALQANYNALVAKQDRARQRQREREMALKQSRAEQYPYYAEISCRVNSGADVSVQGCLDGGGEVQLTTESGIEAYDIAGIYRLIDSNGVATIKLPESFKIMVMNGADADYFTSKLVIKRTLDDAIIKTLTASGSYKSVAISN